MDSVNASPISEGTDPGEQSTTIAFPLITRLSTVDKKITDLKDGLTKKMEDLKIEVKKLEQEEKLLDAKLAYLEQISNLLISDATTESEAAVTEVIELFCKEKEKHTSSTAINTPATSTPLTSAAPSFTASHSSFTPFGVVLQTRKRPSVYKLCSRPDCRGKKLHMDHECEDELFGQ